MPLTAPIFLATGESSAWDVVVWLIAGAIWLVSQIAAAKKQKEKKARQAQQPTSPSVRSGGEDSPTPDELTEIFKRLGADIPATPPPPPKPPPPPPSPRPALATESASATRMARKPAQKITVRKPAPTVSPELARRLAAVKQAAEEAGREAEAARIATNAMVHGVQSRAGESRAFDTSTRHTGMILPRLYAMSMRMAPLPTIPMPGFDHSHHVGKPLRARLHSRREVRDALIAQTLLRPPKALAP